MVYYLPSCVYCINCVKVHVANTATYTTGHFVYENPMKKTYVQPVKSKAFTS